MAVFKTAAQPRDRAAASGPELQGASRGRDQGLPGLLLPCQDALGARQHACQAPAACAGHLPPRPAVVHKLHVQAAGAAEGHKLRCRCGCQNVPFSFQACVNNSTAAIAEPNRTPGRTIAVYCDPFRALNHLVGSIPLT